MFRIGGKRAIAKENIPPADDFTSYAPLSDTMWCSALPPPPLSPSKRRPSRCHYSDVESSPSKKRDHGDRKDPVAFPEKGMLFADTTNTGAFGKADPFDLGELKPRPATKRASRPKPEVVITTTRKPTVRRVRSTILKA